MGAHWKPRTNAELAAKVKASVDVPVSVVGNIFTLEDAEDMLSKGQCDIIGMARSLMADPNLIINGINDQTEKTRPCLRCMECAKYVGDALPVRCSINPILGREAEFSSISKADTNKKVVIVGGGAAGMMAAQTCVQKGHAVVLFEKTARLGGLIHDGSVIEFKGLMRKYLDWNIRMTHACGAEIRLSTEATLEAIDAEHPDAVIVATGSTYIKPNIPGIDNENVRMARDVNNRTAAVGQRVLVCGAGLSGIECAASLAEEGKDVTLLDQISVEAFGSELQIFVHIRFFMQLFKEYNVKLMGSSRITEFRNHGLMVETREGKQFVEADTMVIALGVKAYNPLGDALTRKYPFSTYVVGDCSGRGNILKANHDGFHAAINI